MIFIYYLVRQGRMDGKAKPASDDTSLLRDKGKTEAVHGKNNSGDEDEEE